MGSRPVGISASRGAAVLGLSEYATPFEVWQRICEERRAGFNAERGYVMPPDPDNAAIRWGSAFEDAIVELAQAKRGVKIVNRELLAAADDHEYITCHIDGAYDDGTLTLHEGKTTGLFNYWDSWGEPGTDRIPQIYQVQVQHQMLCTGAASAIISVLVFPRRPEEWEAEGWKPEPLIREGKWMLTKTCKPGEVPNEPYPIDWARVLAEMGLFFQYHVAASPTLQRTLVDAYRDFWDRYVLPEKEPELASYEDVRRAFVAPIGTLIVTEQEERWLRERKEITEEISPTGRLGKRKDELRLLILQAARARIGDAVPDDESERKLVFRSDAGKKLGSFDGKVFR